METYVETFGGMFWCFFNMDLSKYPNLKTVVYNDFNPLNYNLFQCVKNPTLLLEAINSIPCQEFGKENTPSVYKEQFVNFPRKKENGKPFPYGIGYRSHPCTVWARECQENYEWLCELTIEMCKEYTRRYNRQNAGENIVKWYKENRPFLPVYDKMTPFAQAMPDDVKNEDAVIAYRDYYKKYKVKFAKWAHSETPEWWDVNKQID
jgi:hypothetical protein